MSLRLSTKGFSTFIAFNSCTRQISGIQSRTLCDYRSRCLRVKPILSLPKRHSDKRHLHATAPCGAAAKNPYEVLGVKRDASAAEIKKTYFALARKYHPDTNPDKGARDKFGEIQDAYDTLKDEKKRSAYDQYGAASQAPGFDPNAFSAGGFGGFGGPRPGASSFSGSFGGRPAGGFSGFSGAFGAGGQNSDLFDQLFGAAMGGSMGGNPMGGRTRARPQEAVRGTDIEVGMNISFLEACKGTKKTINVTPIIDCQTCDASGLKKGLERTTCASCGGSGTRTFVVDNGFQMATNCNSCGGEGSSIPRGGECQVCGGAGKVRTKTQFSVDIPAGAENGMMVRLPFAGDAPLVGKGVKGDILVRLKVAPSLLFTRQGSNLYYQSKIPFHRALLGGIVRVPTLDGEVDVRIPGGTQQGEEMVLKGRGVPSVSSGKMGDLFVKFSLQLPRSLTKRQRELLQEYADDVEGVSSSTSKPGATSSKEEPLSADNGESSTEKTDEDSKKDDAKQATG